MFIRRQIKANKDIDKKVQQELVKAEDFEVTVKKQKGSKLCDHNDNNIYEEMETEKQEKNKILFFEKEEIRFVIKITYKFLLFSS